MVYDPKTHRRRSMRLKDYNYAEAGAYFVTICTQDRTCLFGDAADDIIHLSDAGRMLAATWDSLPVRFPDVQLDAFVVMPNHVHGVIVLPEPNPSQDAVGAPLVGEPPQRRAAQGATPRVAPTLGDVVGAFKSLTTV